MVNYREILLLLLTSPGYSQRQIAASAHNSRGTISEVLDLLSGSVSVKVALYDRANGASRSEYTIQTVL